MNVLFFSPGFPAEMPYFVRGLAEVGARVWGLGDQPVTALPAVARESLTGYLQVDHLWDVEALLSALAREGPETYGRVECLWEPGMMLAAELRERLEVPGLRPEETLPFRDKGRMKEVLDGAGIRVPRHRRCRDAKCCREAGETIGWPVIVKPIAGAGSADTYRVRSSEELDSLLPKLEHVDEVSVEEYVEGEEYTFDTVCADGEVLYWNVAWYRPRPLVARSLEWISPQTVTLREVSGERLQRGIELGRRVLEALDFRTGFTHMEWFSTPGGEAVFGEIGARPPGARSTVLMNYACDIDVFRGWAEAVCGGGWSQTIRRRFNAAVIFKRARGSGRIRRIDGLERLLGRFGEHVVCLDILPLGHPRRDWRQTLVSDGYVIVRHPDLTTTLEIADRFGTDLQLYAGT